MQTTSHTRNNYLDWLRVIGILAVFIYHSTRFFNMEDWLLKNQTWYPWVEVWNRFATTWMLPLIFVISGASLFYTVGKGSAGKFIKDKISRLLVPLIVCDFTHASLQVYIEQLSHGEFSGSFLEFLPRYFFDDFEPEGLHLWYLLWLFIFSLILYPLMRWLKGKGRIVFSRFGNFLSLPGAILTLAIPTVLLSLVSHPANPVTQFYGGWPLFIYLWLTFTGFIVISEDGIQASVQRFRWFSLAIALIFVCLSLYLLGIGEAPAIGTPVFIFGFTCRVISSWCFVLAFLGFGRKYLSQRNPFLTYANEAVLPFYILHQTILIIVGFFVLQWAIPDLLKWTIIVPVSFVIIMAFYEAFVRRFNGMRFLFGMKPISRKSSSRESKSVEVKAESS